MSFVLDFDHTTRNSTFSHFFLMLGYKLFSFYFPLFLLEKGLSLPLVGFIYLLIYLPFVIAAPVVGAISRKVNPFFLSISGIAGYGLYSLGMLFLPLSSFFYALHVMLGISASLFFVGNRIIFMSLDKSAKSFGWFYSAPHYAAGLAPVIGAVMIFFFGFNGVFTLSIVIHFINILFTLFSMPKGQNVFAVSKSYVSPLSHFFQVIKNSFSFKIFPVLIFSLAILILGGFYQSFFLIFLKSIGWQKTQILTYSSLLSILFLPLSLYGIRILSGWNITRAILIGGTMFAATSIAIGFTASFLGSLGILILMLIGELGNLLSSSSRSGFISKTFSSYPHGAAVLDTVFSPLGTAIGALFGGLLVSYIDYAGVFIFGGIIIAILALSLKSFTLLTAGNKV